MQTSELNKKNNKLIEEECIKFRPSPNFKNMRKYLKSKWEDRNKSLPNLGSDPSTTPKNKEQEIAKQAQIMAQQVNPPLPPYPPPPDIPLMVPKPEVVDAEYNDFIYATTAMPGKVMCRQFARGECTRGPSCIFAHEMILSQLPGLYTFCKMFQNGNCTLVKCKFVHATVFETEHFYRTGYLPPHVFYHLKDSNTALTSLCVLNEAQTEPPPDFSVPPPSLRSGVSALSTNGRTPVSILNQINQISESYSKSFVYSTTLESATKRERSEVDTEMPPGYYGEPLAKKCNSCYVSELKLQCKFAKLRTLLKTKKAYAKQKRELLMCDIKLNIVLVRMGKEYSLRSAMNL